MRLLLLGAGGQLGRALKPRLAALGELACAGHRDIDFDRPAALPAAVRAHRPDVVVNAAAYTAVDRAEREPELAHRINAEAVAELAGEARRLGALLVHFSTDYVFDGRARRPYEEGDPAAPLNRYGQSKLAGERAIAASGARHLILRTSWLYSAEGSNFLLTMLRLAAERPELRVVDDQTGAPTWAGDLADATAAALCMAAPPEGLYHVCAAGQTTWCGFAREILRLAGSTTPVVPITAADYAAPARRPAWSVLDCGRFAGAAGVRIGSWDERLAACMRASGLQARTAADARH